MAVIVSIATMTAGPEVVLFIAPIAVAAGFPSPAQDYFDGPIDLNAHLIKDITSTFIVRISGDSMTGAGISDGDEVIVDRSLDPKHGSVVIAVIDGELTLKRLQLTARGVVLKAENRDYPDIAVSAMSDLTIWGVVTRCLHYVN
jgi:DNA polymerase V